MGHVPSLAVDGDDQRLRALGLTVVQRIDDAGQASQRTAGVSDRSVGLNIDATGKIVSVAE